MLYYKNKRKRIQKKETDKRPVRETKKNDGVKHRREYVEELLQVLSRVANDKALLDKFLRDILSPAEYKEVALRWQIVKRLHKGVPQIEVAENLRVAIGTVTRGARALLNNEGGFNKVLES